LRPRRYVFSSSSHWWNSSQLWIPSCSIQVTSVGSVFRIVSAWR
jgi:hypothetical protein